MFSIITDELGGKIFTESDRHLLGKKRFLVNAAAGSGALIGGCICLLFNNKGTLVVGATLGSVAGGLGAGYFLEKKEKNIFQELEEITKKNKKEREECDVAKLQKNKAPQEVQKDVKKKEDQERIETVSTQQLVSKKVSNKVETPELPRKCVLDLRRQNRYQEQLRTQREREQWGAQRENGVGDWL